MLHPVLRPHGFRGGWCHAHYLRRVRTGDVQADKPMRRRIRAQCAAEGCERLSDLKALCRTHYNRWTRYGDPLADRPIRVVSGTVG